MTRLDERPTVADLDAPRAVSLTIADPIPVKDALMLLVRGTAFSIVIGEGVEGTFSGELKDLALRQALDAVLRPQSLDYTVSGHLITVHRPKPTMRIFDVSFLNVRREWRRGIRSGSLRPGDPPAADFSSIAGTSYYDEIERGIVSLLSTEGRAHVDRRSGVVQVVDFEDRLDRMATYLETVHVRAMRQVRLSARVVEVALSDPLAQAVDWKAVAAHAGGPWAAREGSAGVRVDDFSSVLDALAAQGTVRTLASPQVLAMNNEPAVMRVGTQEVYFRTQEAERGSAESEVTTMRGFTMTITPHIDASGMVQLSVSPTYTGTGAEARPPRGPGLPVITIAEADTVARIRDGDSIVLAGLLQDRTELVILLNATIVTPGPAASRGAR